MNKARAQFFWKQLLMYKNLTQKNQLLCLDFEQIMAILGLKKNQTNKHKNAHAHE